jgi:hypothetical protein
MDGAASSAGRLSTFLTEVPGYFRCGEESIFPWHTVESSVWYSLLTVEEGHICRYGFTSAATGKEALAAALEALEPTDEVLLLGIWTGSHRTDLFVLDPVEALAHLKGPKRFDRFKALSDIAEVQLVRRGRSKHLEYSYVAPAGHRVHTSTSKREEIASLLEYLSTLGIRVRERRDT